MPTRRLRALRAIPTTFRTSCLICESPGSEKKVGPSTVHHYFLLFLPLCCSKARVRCPLRQFNIWCGRTLARRECFIESGAAAIIIGQTKCQTRRTTTAITVCSEGGALDGRKGKVNCIGQVISLSSPLPNKGLFGRRKKGRGRPQSCPCI